MGRADQRNSILFTVDVEEFDTAVEFGHPISLHEQIAVSTRGLRNLAERFDAVGARTTLFTTANYALHEPDLIRALARRHGEAGVRVRGRARRLGRPVLTAPVG